VKVRSASAAGERRGGDYAIADNRRLPVELEERTHREREREREKERVSVAPLLLRPFAPSVSPLPLGCSSPASLGSVFPLEEKQRLPSSRSVEMHAFHHKHVRHKYVREGNGRPFISHPTGERTPTNRTLPRAKTSNRTRPSVQRKRGERARPGGRARGEEKRKNRSELKRGSRKIIRFPRILLTKIRASVRACVHACVPVCVRARW